VAHVLLEAMTIDFRLFKVNLSTGKLIKAVWLDPFSPLPDADREKLAQAHIEPQQVSTVGELNLPFAKRMCWSYDSGTALTCSKKS